MSEKRARARIRNTKRIVVKVGSSVLTDAGFPRPRAFSEIARQVAALHAQGLQITLVSSGAIALGTRTLSWTQPGRSIPELQAAAAVGQIDLVETYRRCFARTGQTVAQVLVTRVGLEDRVRFLNARHTLHALLELGVVPIVNENDTVATDEIRFGDNDNLSATIVNLIGADLLILLTDVDGLHLTPPVAGERRSPVYNVVESITPEIERAAQGAGSAFGRGGMTTKLEAVRSAASCGAATVVCNGRTRGILQRVMSGDPVGTLFLPGKRLASRKHWLAFTARTRGQLVLDDGAASALVRRGRSLLSVGIVEVRGKFRAGDSVSCINRRGRELARGLSAYSTEELERIKGIATAKIVPVLGYSNGDAVIHRDDLVLMDDLSGA